MKIGIIDDGIDQTPSVLLTRRLHDAAGLPEGADRVHDRQGDRRPRLRARRARRGSTPRKPFDPCSRSTRRTSPASPRATPARRDGGAKVSGIAPQAYIGNYKALSVPTDADVGLDGNAAEIVAAIEAAVADGMDVINLSIGEPEVEPSRDIVALALDAAAAAGVVPVVAAGNDFEEFGAARSISPGTSDRAITVAAVTSPTRPAARPRRLQRRRARRRSRCA